eukprot:SAG22_NODE_4767_length_1170_cov_1.107376_1_plen_74_part_10
MWHQLALSSFSKEPFAVSCMQHQNAVLTSQPRPVSGWTDEELNEFGQQHGVVMQAATPMARGLPALVQHGANNL